MSISAQMGPQICMEKGPRVETAGKSSARPSGAGQGSAAWARAVAGFEHQARFLKRQLFQSRGYRSDV